MAARNDWTRAEPAVYNRGMPGTETLTQSRRRPSLARTLSAPTLALAVTAMVLIDQAAKVWVQQNVPPRAHLPLVGDVLWLAHYANYGAAGGLGWDQPWVVPALIVAGILLIPLLLVGYRLYSVVLGPSWRMQSFVALAVAPLICTLLDRVRLGYVVDFLYLPGLPVFNLGDLLPQVGTLFVALELGVVVKRRYL